MKFMKFMKFTRMCWRLFRSSVVRCGALLACLVAVADVSYAHPHIFVTSRSVIVYDDTGAIVGIRHAWTFDEGYSAFAIQGLDTNADGLLSREELHELATVNAESLHEFDFFTFATFEDKDVAFAAPQNYWLDYDGASLTLHLTLPLETALRPGSKPFALDVYDPTYYVAFDLTQDDGVSLAGAHPGCKLAIERAGGLDDGIAMTLAQIPASERTIPQDLMSVTQTLANTATVTCPAS